MRFEHDFDDKLSIVAPPGAPQDGLASPARDSQRWAATAG